MTHQWTHKALLGQLGNKAQLARHAATPRHYPLEVFFSYPE